VDISHHPEEAGVFWLGIWKSDWDEIKHEAELRAEFFNKEKYIALRTARSLICHVPYPECDCFRCHSGTFACSRFQFVA
jgi:hypothetical protein